MYTPYRHRDLRLVRLSGYEGHPDKSMFRSSPDVDITHEEIDLRTYAAWGKGLSVQQYLDREGYLRKRDLCRNMVMHALVRDEPGQAKPTILASCESYRVPMVAFRESSFCHGIGSVYVDPEHRGRGYASDLLIRIRPFLGQFGCPLVYLMSDIGESVYGRLGFVPIPVRTLFLRASDQKPVGAQWIRRDELWQVLTHNEWYERWRLPDFKLFPVFELVDWHLARSQYYSDLFNRPMPDYAGAICEDSLMVWAPDYRPPHQKMWVLLLSAEQPGGAVETLVDAVCNATYAAGLTHCLMWVSDEIADLMPTGAIIPSEVLPMVRVKHSLSLHGLSFQRMNWL